MTKQLTPLEALERLRPKTTYLPYYTRSEKRYYCDIIETELKRTEDYDFLAEHYKELNVEYKRQKEILRIIKEKDVKVWEIKSCDTYEEYNDSFEEDLMPHSCLEKQLLTKEEFDLLKEYFK